MNAAHILYLAHRVPCPPDKGDKIRSYNTIHHLARRFRVHLCAFADNPRDLAHTAYLESVCESVTLIPLNRKAAAARSVSAFFTGAPLTSLYYRDPKMCAAVAKARAIGLSAEIAFSSAMAQYIAAQSNAPRLVDLCDADSAKWAEYSQRRKWPMSAVYKREGRRLALEEARIVNWANASFAISKSEADLLGALDGVQKGVRWFCNGVDAVHFAPGVVPAAEKRFSCVFTGAMDYWANIDAVRWFAREIWPEVRASISDARLAVVGADPARAVRAFNGVDGIEVTGRVDDVRPFLEGAALVIAPMRIARGVQNKVLEAMAMGKPVISTPAGLEGINAQIGSEAIAAAAPQSFAAEIIRLLNDVDAARAIGEAARSRVLAEYQWPAQLSRLDAAIDELIRNSPAP
ncbi:MAG: TIGR03087 family PEP-CTERM/XrtA system glycosyltransferase [Parvularculaceae bacterium]|nr:TIGR03087 family PEP-CTERM/XrtA system glycosyltransferase [Parvularculaceae bacterium]